MSADVSDTDHIRPRRFLLVRRPDPSGADQPHVVAEGTIWSTGQVAVHQAGQCTSTSLWASLDDLITAQVLADRTTLEWIDEDWEEVHSECVEYYGGAIWIR